MAKRRQISFRDRIAGLTRRQAMELLGPQAEHLLRLGGGRFDIDPEEDVYLGGDLFRVRLADANCPGGKAIVVVTQIAARNQTLHVRCDQCETVCEHAGAALGFLLENRLALGLSAPPDESVPFELLTDDELRQRALADREQRAASEAMIVKSTDPTTPWTDYTVTNRQTGKTYRVALRGLETSVSYCSCPDFRTNHLGTCKHIIHALAKVQQRFSQKKLQAPYRRRNLSVRLHYGEDFGLRFNLPDKVDATIKRWAAPYSEQSLNNAQEAVRRLRLLTQKGHDVHVYPDAEEWLDRETTLQRVRQETDAILEQPDTHPLRTSLLKSELLPYQLQGAAFAAGAGRAVLADDMGLGKTIQGIAVAELLARLADIQRVLLVCPASLKSQWRSEIQRFCDRSAQLVIGNSQERRQQYQTEKFFTICNYEQVLRDLEPIERVDWDLIILDEGQRIKNWESKTSQVIRSLHSRYALVLSGTPLENRLDDLFTVVRFIDERRLGPAQQFFQRHRIVDDKGRVHGYQRLDELRTQLKPILLRRTREQVMKQLPERTTDVVRITPTEEQLELHSGHMRTVLRITRQRYLTEMDLLRLQKALLMCRLAANSTFLVDKEPPGYSSKLDRLGELLEELAPLQQRKLVIFSEWRRMLDSIEPLLERVDLNFVRLDGQVPQKQRPALVKQFQEDPQCRAILMTNAGSTGLNLQSANTVINVDLPWNPAVLEQRIARAHRMGQKNPVHVYVLVTENTLEERLLESLSAKHDLALAALDAASDVNQVEMVSGVEELKRRLEKLLGAQPDAPLDRSQQERVRRETQELAQRRERVASAGGQLVGAALELVGELVQDAAKQPPDEQMVLQLHSALNSMLEHTQDGRPQLRITLDDDSAVHRLAQSLARLLVAQ